MSEPVGDRGSIWDRLKKNKEDRETNHSFISS